MREVTPQPGYTEADVTNLLATRQFVRADCYTITPLIGPVMRYTTAQQRVSVVPVGEVTRAHYEADIVLINGLLVKMSIGVDADEQKIDISYPQTDDSYQDYLSWPFALMTGRLDGATISRDRYIASDWGQPFVGGWPMFRGLVSTLDSVGRSSATINVKSDLIKLNVQMPRDLWEPNCKNTWGDPGCGVDQSDWAVIGEVGSGATRSAIPWSSASAHYNLGKVHIADSDSVTRIRTISHVSGGVLHLSYPLDFDPVEDMTFTAYPGCPRTLNVTYGCPKYHGDDHPNRFRGFPFVPVAETSI